VHRRPQQEAGEICGLALCSAVIEQLGGAIEASLVSDGTFTITIRPRAD